MQSERRCRLGGVRAPIIAATMLLFGLVGIRTATAQIPITGSPRAIAAVDGVAFYFTPDNHLIELFEDGTTPRDITAQTSVGFVLGRSDSPIAVKGTSGEPQVYFIASDGHVWQFYFSLLALQWLRLDLTAETSAPTPAPGSALAVTGVSAAGTVLLDPRVYYVTADNHIQELALWGGGWHSWDITTANGIQAPLARLGSALSAISVGAALDPRVYYFSANNHIQELAWDRDVPKDPNSAKWHTLDVSMANGIQATAAAGDSSLAGIAVGAALDPRVYYFTADNHVHELAWYIDSLPDPKYLNGKWHTRDVSTADGIQVPKARPGSALAAIGAGEMLDPRVYYFSAESHVEELAWFKDFPVNPMYPNGKWHMRDLTYDLSALPATRGSALAATGVGDAHNPRVNLFSDSHQVEGFAWNSGRWSTTFVGAPYSDCPGTSKHEHSDIDGKHCGGALIGRRVDFRGVEESARRTQGPDLAGSLSESFTFTSYSWTPPTVWPFNDTDFQAYFDQNTKNHVTFQVNGQTNTFLLVFNTETSSVWAVGPTPNSIGMTAIQVTDFYPMVLERAEFDESSLDVENGILYFATHETYTSKGSMQQYDLKNDSRAWIEAVNVRGLLQDIFANTFVSPTDYYVEIWEFPARPAFPLTTNQNRSIGGGFVYDSLHKRLLLGTTDIPAGTGGEIVDGKCTAPTCAIPTGSRLYSVPNDPLPRFGNVKDYSTGSLLLSEHLLQKGLYELSSHLMVNPFNENVIAFENYSGCLDCDNGDAKSNIPNAPSELVYLDFSKSATDPRLFNLKVKVPLAEHPDGYFTHFAFASPNSIVGQHYWPRQGIIMQYPYGSGAPDNTPNNTVDAVRYQILPHTSLNQDDYSDNPIHLAISPDGRFIVQNIEKPVYNDILLWFKTPAGYSAYKISTGNCPVDFEYVGDDGEKHCPGSSIPTFVDNTTILFNRIYYHKDNTGHEDLEVLKIPGEILNLDLMPLTF
jgi:hypothetical protein